MKDIKFITGATGKLAKFVSQHLASDYEIRNLTTKKTSSSQNSCFYWNIKTEYIDSRALENCKHIIHLAGFPILKRWNKKNKKAMYDSRVKAANLIFDKCKKMNIKPSSFISASAIGIYDQSVNDQINEAAPKGRDWLAKMACEWEDAANQFKTIGSRVVQMRISLIFSKSAGFLKYNLLSMKYGVGAIVGNKNRLVNWMHAEDISRFIKKSIMHNNYSGAYNLACDDKISQEKFVMGIKKTLFPYAIIIKIPMFIVKFFIGERHQIIDSDLSLDTNKMKNHGFKCKINSLEKLLEIKK